MFWSCKKESIADQSTITNTQSKTDLISPIITVSSATTFFKEKFGDDKVGLLRSLPTNLLGDTVRYIPTNIDIKPTWSKAQISTLLKVNPILVVPVENIPTLDASKEGYSLVFYNDSLGHMQSVLQCYVPTIDYYKKVNGKNSTSDFTGYLYQISMSGKIQKVLKIDNGKILGELHHGKLSGTPADGPSDCYNFGGSFWGGISSFFGSLWSGVTNFFNDLPVNSSDPYGGGNNFPPTGSSSGYGDGTLSGFGGGTTSIFDAGNRNLPDNIYDAATLKSGLITFGISEFNYNYYIRQHPELEAEILNFIVTRSGTNTNLQAVLNEYQSLDAATLTQYFNLLATNNDFYTACKESNWDWVDAYDKLLRKLVFRGLSNEEKRLARIYGFAEASLNFEAQIDAVLTTKFIYGSNSGPNNDRNIANSFQHAYWNANVAAAYGKNIANIWGNAHEDGATDIASVMDYWNNDQGSKIGENTIGTSLTFYNQNRDIVRGLAKKFVLQSIANGEMKYVCVTFDPVNVLQVIQTLKFTNQPCP